MSEVVTCDECGLFEIPSGYECCRVCMSVNRGIPLDDMTTEEFDSFRHRMLKKERLENDRLRKTYEEERKRSSARIDAMAAVLRNRETGEYAGKLSRCNSCCKLLGHSEKAKYGCRTCFTNHMETLRTTGLPYVKNHAK
jgi:hypothetical protein